MTNHLQHLAQRLQDDPFFLACPLKLYARSEGLTEAGLAAAFGCSDDALLSVRLCRAPAAQEFFEGIQRIATTFAVDADTLAEAVRRGQALFAMTRRPGTSGTLMAARDRDDREEGRGSP